MYRVDRNNFYQENKNASIQTPEWVSNFLFELLNSYIKKEGMKEIAENALRYYLF